MALKIITIVPRLPPLVDGVGDYAFQLAQALRTHHQIETQFIVCDPDWEDATAVAPFPVTVMAAASETALLNTLCQATGESSIVLFQLSGYGYHKWSMYRWMVNALTRWKRHYGDRAQLVTMFHELYKPMGRRPWRHRFWFGPEQKALIKRLSRLSDACVTNCTAYATDLARLSRGQHCDIPVLPVFSNISAPRQPTALADRPRRLVVFGLAGTRARVYHQSIAAVNAFCAQFGIEAVVDLGAPTGLDLASRLMVPVIEMGYQSPDRVSELLGQAIAGWTFYDADLLSKSGIFAAYCAHGLVPIVSAPTRSRGLATAGATYLAIDTVDQVDATLNDRSLQLIADRAHDWYQSHTLDRQAQIFADQLHVVAKQVGIDFAEVEVV